MRVSLLGAVAIFAGGMALGYAVHSYRVNLAYIKVENLASTQMITPGGECMMGKYVWPSRDGWCYMNDAPLAATIH